MKLIISLIVMSLLAALFGYLTKAVNESKGYKGGFWLGFWPTFLIPLFPGIGVLIISCKKEQPNAKPNAFRAVPIQNVFKKYHYPFVSPQVEPIDILKGNIHAEGEAAATNITFLLIHGIFMLCWYALIFGIYFYYLFGYTIYWLFKYRPLKK